jgi:hypothetical protein
MAGDWIKFQIDTPDKPEVLAIASRLGIDPDAVVGKLIRVWSWFDKHTVDGNAHSVTFSFLDRLTSVTGFAEQMQFVGWLEQDGSILRMKNFDYHNGKSAKSRALGKDRQEKHRNNNANNNAHTVTKPSLEKRREEKNINTPEGVSDSVFKDYLFFRKTIKAPVTETVIKGLTAEAQKANMSLEQVMILCCQNGWRGFKADWMPKEKEDIFTKHRSFI